MIKRIHPDTAMLSLFALKNLLRPANERVAVIIPVYNVTTYLEAAIRSAITQDYPYKEIIVVDDGSEEPAATEIRRICQPFGTVVTLLHQPHSGAGEARDHGVHHTSAELILFLDADDVLLPGAMRYLVRGIWRHPHAVAVYGGLQQTDETGALLKDPQTRTFTFSGRDVLYHLLERRNPFSNGAICIRKQALEKLSGCNHRLRFGEDWVLWCHLALSGEIVSVGKRIVLHYRRHDGNVNAAFLENPSPLFIAFERVFTNPVFIAAVGKEKLQQLNQKLLSRIHIELAMAYLKEGDAQRAQYYLERVSVPVSTLFSSKN
ncbi:MAG TPA: glycosyltransferase family 2 protein [Rickettsiales bacterium]|nr:glycosyltransferase family 2 protein [Rickettsiales bacterium]